MNLTSAISDAANEVWTQRTNQAPNVSAFDFASPLAKLIDNSLGVVQPEPLFSMNVSSNFLAAVNAALQQFFSALPGGGNASSFTYVTSMTTPLSGSVPALFGSGPGYEAGVGVFGTGPVASPTAAGQLGYALTSVAVSVKAVGPSGVLVSSLTPAQQTAYRQAHGLVAPSSLPAGSDTSGYDQQSSDF